MKKLVFPLVVVLSLFIVFLSCSNKPKRSRKPVITINVLPTKKNYNFSEEVAVKVETKVKDGEIQNIRLFYKNELIKESNELDFTVDNIKLNELGSSNFKVVATKTDGVENSKIKSIPVFSDISPKKYSYQTVHNYPHSKKFYTQGLEFYNGFFYEGTGENGKSGLYKVNPATGNPVQSVLLDEVYFGEGITILNNKIYQITYRNQKGFIYNLSDFALIDSFQYKSKEGWGLTNDGENLIMSDGTNVLTWLNPETFSVVKTVQVTNNQGFINNLNELEYIDGTIYANVYTTDVIVQIEPETGRILSEINLDGILNMFKNPKDTIDYLNGIAYDKEKDRLFVTGKWWPRLFEIELKPLN